MGQCVRLVALVGVVLALSSSGHAAMMASGGAPMHEDMSSSGAMVLMCFVAVVGLAVAGAALRADAPHVFDLVPQDVAPLSPFVAPPPTLPARASPAWFQRFRR